MATKISQDIGSRLEERTSRALAATIASAIGDGTIANGALLPSIRALADELGLSPSTVSAAWRLLARAGVIRTDGRRGTVASAAQHGPVRYRRALESTRNFSLDLSTGTPDPTLLPDLGPSLANLGRNAKAGSYLDDPLLPGLAEVLEPTWPSPLTSLAVVDGVMDGLDEIASLLLRLGDLVIVENPAFPPLLDLLDALGAKVLGVPLDDEGLVPEALSAALSRRPRALFLQPRAQNPTGITMSSRRAHALAALLRPTSTLIVEDDSVGDIATSPPVSIGRHLPDQTIHLRSFSKSHGPDLRLAAMSGPANLMDGLRERRYLGQGWTSRLLQAVLLDLLTRDSSQAQVAAARQEYKRRRDAMAEALAARGVTTVGGDGLNLWLDVHDETSARVALASQGIGAAAGSPFVTGGGVGPHLRVTVGLVSGNFEQVADALVAASKFPTSAGPR